jgi:hypothetical protein
MLCRHSAPQLCPTRVHHLFGTRASVTAGYAACHSCDGWFALVLAALPVKAQVVGAASVCSLTLNPACAAQHSSAAAAGDALLIHDQATWRVRVCMLLSGRTSKGYGH